MPFHKSCYTSRSSGYKYRTLSTNTGEKKKVQRPSIQQGPEVSSIDQKFHNLHEDVSILISKELDETDRSRGIIYEKVVQLDTKINSMVELRDNVMSLRQTLCAAENALGDLYQRLQSLEVMTEVNSVKLRKNGNRTKDAKTVAEDETEQEIFSSEMTASPVVAL